MHPFFPPASNPNNPNNNPPQQGSTPVPNFPFNPQFPMANFPNPNNFTMAMNMLNQNPQLGMQLGFNQAFQNLNALAAMQFLGQAAQFQQGQAQNPNFFGAGQLLANNLAQGFNQMANNPMLAPFNMVQMNHANGSTSSSSNPQQNPVNNNQNNNSLHRFQNNQFNPPSNPNQFNGTRGRGRGRGFQSRRGESNWREGKPDCPPVFPERRKNKLPLITYDLKEIKEWREARKRNFPTNSNIEKKLAKEAKLENDETELRREQMKKVLAKQKELGFEAAEVPTHYLIGSKSKPHFDPIRNSNRYNNKRGRNGGGRGRNYNNAPRNNNRREFVAKEKEPSLLKKLLSADIKADKIRVLQGLRFMVLNEFFDGDREELEFPQVRVKGEDVILEELEDVSENEVEERESENEGEERESESGEREEEEKPEEGEITD